MLFENLEVSGSLKGQGLTKPPRGSRAARPSSPVTGSIFLEESSLNTGWTDYGGNSAHYTVINADNIIIKNTSTGWIGYFVANTTIIGKHVVQFTYSTSSGTSSLVIDNDGIDDNTFNNTLSATTTPQVYKGTVSTSTTGQIRMFMRHNGGGGDITINNFRLVEQINEGKNYLMVYTGLSVGDSGWERISSQNKPGSVGFRYRQIISTSYLAGGYKSSSPWKNVHKTINATDQTTHLGELLDYPANYTAGACGTILFFMFSVNTDNAHHGPTTVHGTYTSAVNMINDTNELHQSNFDTQYARGDLGVLFKETERAYIFAGGTSTMEVFDLINHTTITTQTIASSDSNEGASAFSDEHHGYGYGSFGGFKFNFATDTQTSSTKWAAHGQQKGISSKVDKGYCGNEGSYAGGYNLRRWSNNTDTNLGNVVKPDGNTGEENFTMGQDWQYMLGNYNGAQNNNSWKFYYATDTGTTSVSGLNPGVNAGTSSGHCGWR